jgi:glycosyltransferase involved in cell wall biosynthesis
MTTTRGTIAVVIPTRNGAGFIAETLRSAIAQTRPPARIVVVDDGSTDDTTSVVSALDQVDLLVNPDRGASRARAIGVAATESDYIAFLDHDDMWHPHHLERLAGLLDQAPHPLAYSEVRTFTGALGQVSEGVPSPQLVDLWNTFPVSPVGGPSRVVVRRSALEQIGGWPDWNRVPTDMYVWFRLADIGEFVWWPAVTVGWRRHEASQTYRMGRDDPVTFVRNRVELLHEALDIHLAALPADADRLSGRLDELEALLDVFVAMCTVDIYAMRLGLEHYARHDAFSPDLIPYFRRSLIAALDGEPSTQRNLWRAYGSWPREHRGLRRLIADPAVATNLVSTVCRHPRQPSQWGLPLAPGTRHAALPLIGALSSAVLRRSARAVASVTPEQ